jgi:hypothetical protein
VLIRSAETLGRMIGSLHRQLDSARKRFTGPADEIARESLYEAMDTAEGIRPQQSDARETQRRARAASTSRASSASTKSQKSQSTAERKSKRASKSARAMKKK